MLFEGKNNQFAGLQIAWEGSQSLAGR